MLKKFFDLSKIRRHWNFRNFGLIVLVAGLVLVPLSLSWFLPSARAGFIKKWKERIRQRASSWSRRVRQRVRSWGHQVRQRVRSWGHQVRRRVRSWGHQVRRRVRSWGHQVRRRVRTWGHKAGKRVRTWGHKTGKRVRTWGHKTGQRVRSLAKQQYQGSRRWLDKRYSGLRGTINRWRGRIRYSAAQRIQRIRAKFGEMGTRMVETAKKYGVGAQRAISRYLTRAKGYGLKLIHRSQGLIEKASQYARDPRVQKRVVMGVIAASAVAYYAYKNKDELKYKLVKFGLKNTMITVHGQKKSLHTVISGAILDRAPFLRGTKLGEDPAAVLTYGVVAVAKDDLMNSIQIVPDGKGNLTSINQAINKATGANEATKALQLGSALEGMAMTAAERGVLGVYGKQFVGTYKTLDAVLE